jgi:hypothetical protein
MLKKVLFLVVSLLLLTFQKAICATMVVPPKEVILLNLSETEAAKE